MKNLISLVLVIFSILFNGCEIFDLKENTNLSIKGEFNNWTLGNDKQIVFGNFDEQTEELTEFGSGTIFSNGSFTIDSLDIPFSNEMETIGNGPGFSDECSNSFNINNPDAQIATGEFFIVEKSTNKIVGGAIAGVVDKKNRFPAVGDIMIDYVYVFENVTITGTNTCNGDNNFSETINSNVTLNEGWNTIIIETLELSDNSASLSFTNGENIVVTWTYFTDDTTDTGRGIEGDYEFSVEGKFDFWDGTSDKEIQFGQYDFTTEEFLILASAPVSNEGKFTFSTAPNLPLHLLRPIEEGPGNPENCSQNLSISNPDAIGGEGNFRLVEANTKTFVGNVHFGLDIENNGRPDAGDIRVVTIFVSEDANIGGTTTCTENVEGNSITIESTLNLSVIKGWNFIISKIISSDQSSLTEELTNGNKEEAVFYLERDFEEYDPEYSIDISGTFENWGLGRGKQLRFGEIDFNSGEFIVFAESDITESGSFSINIAASPSRHLVFPADQGFVDPRECEINISSNNPNALGGFGKLIVFDPASQSEIGWAVNMFDGNDNDLPDTGDFEIEYFFVSSSIDITGITNCSHLDHNGEQITENRTYNLSLFEGWNKFQRKFINIDHNFSEIEFNIQSSSGTKWYFRSNN